MERHIPDAKSGSKLFDSICRPVFFISAGLIVLVCIYGVGFSEHAAVTFSAIQDWLVTSFGWFYMVSIAFFFGFVVYLAFSRFANIKLGPDDSEPDYSYVSWFSMLFSAGMGIGLLFFGVSEPLTHFAQPPTGIGGTAEAAGRAMEITFFHWGLQAWSVYIVVGLSLAYFSFRHGLPLSIRSALYPLIGDRIYGPIGHTVDIFAVLGTMFGVATSLGLGVMQVNAGLSYLFDVEVSTTVQIILIVFITAMATISVVAGLDAGIRRLSELNLLLAVVMLVFILLAGPTATLLGALLQNVGGYLSSMVDMTFNLHAYQPIEWMGDWTLFYWGWWISWSPFVGMFIARISRGRTIREFIIGVLLVPAGFTFLWLSLFGNTALIMELADNGISLVNTALEDSPTTLFMMLEQLPWSTLMSLVATLLIMTFFVTSSDSGSLVIDIITSGGNEDPPVWQRIFWAVTEGVVAAALLLAGGLSALQTAAISSALPFACVMFLMCLGLYKGLNMEALKQPYGPGTVPRVPQASSSKQWQQRLRALIGEHRQQDVRDFIEKTVRPAMQAVALQIDASQLQSRVEEAGTMIKLIVDHGTNTEFKYEIRLREYGIPSVAFPKLPQRDQEKTYWRAEVHLNEGPQKYDVAGYTVEQLTGDLLAQFEMHMQWLHAKV
ncbi:MAG: BCCT family transporter [Pseudomonadales bacterium]|jgi:choline/glycine/proline betaine transport protein|tara:strand:+ start:3645 stop:5633 length:1989 start_codon:yes stop_codon:yes gene_type:complete